MKASGELTKIQIPGSCCAPTESKTSESEGPEICIFSILLIILSSGAMSENPWLLQVVDHSYPFLPPNT